MVHLSGYIYYISVIIMVLAFGNESVELLLIHYKYVPLLEDFEKYVRNI